MLLIYFSVKLHESLFKTIDQEELFRKRDIQMEIKKEFDDQFMDQPDLDLNSNFRSIRLEAKENEWKLHPEFQIFQGTLPGNLRSE